MDAGLSTAVTQDGDSQTDRRGLLQFKRLNRDGADGDGCEDVFCDWRVDLGPRGSRRVSRGNASNQDVQNKGRKKR